MSDRRAILLVDDRVEEVRPLLAGLAASFDVLTESMAERALQRVAESPEIGAVLLDLHFDGQALQGEQVLEQLKERFPQLPVLILTASSDVSLALKLVHTERKAHYYFVKDEVDTEQLAKAVENAFGYYRLGLDKIRMTDRGPIVGSSAVMEQALRRVARVAQLKAPVLITGEAGTGKELFARAIHLNGPRAKRPFVAVNCGALPRELVASELFGTAAGAFTGATNRKGLFERANLGTIFLDEIGELPLENQASLLRVVESGEVQRVGGDSISADVRILAATNRDLRAAIGEKTFREDLLFRLAVLSIQLPALRDRPEDIPELVEHFLVELRPGATLAEEGYRVLREYDWPGNVRELRSALNSAMLESDSDVISSGDLERVLKVSHRVKTMIETEWAERVLRGEADWQDLRREFKTGGDILKRVVDCTIRAWQGKQGRRISGNELADVLGTNRNHVSQILNQLDLRLKDYD